MTEYGATCLCHPCYTRGDVYTYMYIHIVRIYIRYPYSLHKNRIGCTSTVGDFIIKYRSSRSRALASS